MNKIIEDYNLNGNDELFLEQLEAFSFPKYNLGFKKDRNLHDFDRFFKDIPSIENKNILYDERFIKSFYRIFWGLISNLGIATQNFYIFVPEILENLNRITVTDYVIYDCRSTDYYNCGRAMSIIDKYPSRFLIYNSDHGYMDLNTQILYNQGCIKIEKDKKEVLSKRIMKEVALLQKHYSVKVYGRSIYLKRDKYKITLHLPKNYPFESPYGTFNGRTISEIDLDWKPEKTLLLLADKLIIKYEAKLMPILRLICDYL